MKTKPQRAFVIPDLSILTSREREAWGHRAAGRPAREAAEAMGCSVPCVYMFWHIAMKRVEHGPNARAALTAERESKEERAANVPRCRCGLALPCNNCLPTIEDVALGRSERGDASTAGRVSVSGNARSGAVSR